MKQIKKLSQVCLNTDWPIRDMISLLEKKNITHVLEIGPGGGVLTKLLFESGFHVTAIERDERFFSLLEKEKLSWLNKNNIPHPKIIRDDILHFNISDWITEQSLHKKAIVGNLPYHITTPIVEKIFSEIKNLDFALIMTQKEYAERIASVPNKKSYSSFSVFCQLQSKPQLEFIVPRENFSPIPKVDSAIISFSPLLKFHDQKLLDKALKISRLAFQGRRKMLKNTLSVFSIPWEKTSLSSTLRPEHLTPENFLELASLL